jgi:hypothetical protein
MIENLKFYLFVFGSEAFKQLDSADLSKLAEVFLQILYCGFLLQA